MATRTATRTRTTARHAAAAPTVDDSIKTVQRFARARRAELRRLTAVDLGEQFDAAGRRFKRAARGATTFVRGSMDDAAEAGKEVRHAMKQAAAAVTRAGRRIAQRFSAAARTAAPTARPARKPVARRSARAAA